MKLFLFFSLLVSHLVQASILPSGLIQDKDLLVQRNQSITREQVLEIVHSIKNHFAPIVSGHKATLVINTYFDDLTVNLFAEQVSFTWFIHLHGGYLELEGMGPDELTLSLCHELGHHLAGYPYKSSWSCAEGQADYFATHVCTSQLWKNSEQLNSQFRQKIDSHSKQECDGLYDTDSLRDLCYRQAVASLNLANIMAKFSGTPPIDPAFKTPFPVEEILLGHPDAQCRFETFLSGALCNKEFDPHIIPGKKPATVVPVPRPPMGYNDQWARQQSQKFHCQEPPASRPTCWFK